jgi:two-component system chemotaxis sensor kinase CheA
LQAISQELAFLSPQSVASIGVVVSALAALKQSPQFQSQADVLVLIQQEHAWAQQVEDGIVAVSEADLERLKASYFRIEEALAKPIAPAIRATPPSQPAAADVSLGDEPSLYIRASDDIELLNEFCNEGRELLEQIEQGLLVLEEEPQHKEMLNQVFRAFHTFKGGAGLLELTPVKLLAHELESLLSAARNGHLQINPRVIDLILGGADLMRSFVDLIGQRLAGVNPDEPVQIPINALIARVSACLNGEDEPAPAPAPEPPALVENEKLSSPEKAAQPPPTHSPTPIKPPSTAAAHAENLISFVKLDTRKLDQLVDLVGELVIAQSLVVQNPQVQSLSSLGLAAQLRQLARITTDLQQTAMSMRMVPIRGIFQKMSRLVRDLSVSQNKQVRLQLLGEDTEIDRNMIEELADPLMHMIRNAVDHGVEPPQVRLDNGKPAEGTIKLEASHRDGGIAITISDDGRGMDPNRIKNKAIEKQLISASDLLSTSEIFDLIFQPGFSTAEAITEVSGRGVGMDVVRGHIANLRGRVEVQSTLGEGSQFTIRLPLTLAIIDGMLLSVGEERFILPTLSIRESFKPQTGMISKVQGRGEVVTVRGKLIPLVRLHEQLEIPSHITEPVDGIVVVVQSRSQMRGILVDGLIGKSEVVIKPLGETFKHAFGMTGCAILGDGRVALILDPDALGTLQRTAHKKTALSTAAFH